MTDKITLADLSNLENESSAVSAINSNNAILTTALNNTLSRDGTLPNTMTASLDMNGQQILNLPAPATVDSPARLADVLAEVNVDVPPTGTSGAVVPFLNGNNTWSGDQDFTGVAVTVATQSPSDNSTNAASTAYVDAAVGDSAGTLPGLSVTGRAGTTTGAPAAITGTASQFLGVNSGATALGFQTLAGDATLSGPTLTLATVNSNTGALGSSTAIPTITTNGKGLVTAVSTNAVVAPASTITGTTLASNVVTTSITTLAANVQHGADAASPATSSLQAESTLTGTNNQAGANFTIGGSKGTGTGAGGQVLIKTAPAGGSGTTQNALATGLTVTAPAINMQPSVVVGNQALATTDTDGFLYIAGGAGAPAGTPTAFAGRYPLYWDHTNKKMYIYDGSWLGSTAPGVWS